MIVSLMNNELERIWKQQLGHNLRYYLDVFACKDYEKKQETSVSTNCLWTEIWEQGLFNTKQECYPLYHYDIYRELECINGVVSNAVKHFRYTAPLETIVIPTTVKSRVRRNDISWSRRKTLILQNPRGLNGSHTKMWRFLTMRYYKVLFFWTLSTV
jgi:hypothetical protein